MNIKQITNNPSEMTQAATLVCDYIIEGSERSIAAAGISFAVSTDVEAAADELKKFTGKTGALYGVEIDGTMIGVGAFRDLGNGRAEMKRVYVAPEYRRKGVGRKLVTVLIDSARIAGFTSMVIESGYYLAEARKLYESLGFIDICPYEGAECGALGCEALYYMEMIL